jgi:hypothetical protein
MTEIDINPVQPIAIKRLSAAFYKRDPRFGCPSLEHAISPCILRLSLANGALDVIIETHARHDLDGVRQQADSGRLRLLVGDESELSTFDLSRPYGNLLQVEVDVGRGQIECVAGQRARHQLCRNRPTSGGRCPPVGSSD